MTDSIDYLHFCCGVVYLAIPLVLRLRGRGAGELPYAWLGGFGLAQAAHAWLWVLAVDLGDSSAFAAGRCFVQWAGWAALLEFGRRGLQARGAGLTAWRVYAPLLMMFAAVAVGGVGVILGIARYVLGFSSGALAAWALWRDARDETSGLTRFERAVGTALFLQGPLWALAASSATDWSAGLRAVLALVGGVGCASGVWIICGGTDRLLAGSRRFTPPLVAAMILLVLGGGWWAAAWRSGEIDAAMRRELLSHATSLASTLNPTYFQSLSFTLADRDRPEFVRLCDQFRAYAQCLPCLGIYTTALRDGELRFGPESYREDHPLASPAGTVYELPSPNCYAIFRTGRAYVEGPVTDEYGTFVSAYAPIRDLQNGEVLASVGIDVDAAQWESWVAADRLIPIGCTAVLVALIAYGCLLVQWRRTRIDRFPSWWRHVETAVVAVGGVMITLAVTWAVREDSFIRRNEAFTQLADAQAERFGQSLVHQGKGQLHNITDFLGSDPDVDERRFAAFAQHVLRESFFQAVAWFVPVPHGSDDEPCGATPGAGTSVPREYLRSQSRCYPLRYVLATDGFEADLRCDLASEPLRRAALREALRTGLPTATDPIQLVGSRSRSPGILVLDPHFADGERRVLGGITLCAFQPERTIRSILASGPSIDQAADVELYQILSGAAPRRLASTADDAGSEASLAFPPKPGRLHPAAPLPTRVYPHLAFGKTYVLAIRARDPFLHLYSTTAVWGVLLAGLALTAAMTALTGALVRRSVELEEQVRARTAELTEQIERYDLVVAGVQDAVWDWDVLSDEVLLSPQWHAMRGLEDDERCRDLESVLAFIHLDDLPHVQAAVKAHCAGGTPHVDAEYRIRRQDGTWRWVRGRGLAQHDAAGRLVRVAGSEADITERKLEDERLRESENLQRTLLDNLTAGVVIVDAATHVIERVNPAAARLFGAPAEHIVGNDCHRFLCPAERGACPISDQGQRVDDSDRLLVRADGSYLPILKTVTRITLAGREKLMESFVDISGRVRAERDLRASQGLLAATLHSIGDGVISTDTRGRVTRLNAVAESLTGWTAEQARGRPVTDVFHVVRSDTGEGAEVPVARVLREGQIVASSEHVTLVHCDGSERQVASSCSPIRNEDDELLGAVLVFRDVTEEYLRIEELRESRERFSQTADLSREIIWEVDSEGLYTYMSPACLSLLGYHEQEVVGILHFYDLHPEEGREAFRQLAFETIRRRERFVDFHNLLMTKDGRSIDVLTNGMPILDDRGQLLGYRGSDRDVTRQRRYEEELCRYAAALEEANRTLEDLNRTAKAATRAKSEFLANMSHEIRTPMTAILGYAQLLLAEDGLERAPPHRVAKFRAIERNGQHLLALINDILDLSKIEAGKLHVERIACSPADLLDEVVSLMQVRADAKELPLVLEYATPIPATIHTDPTRLRQILVNLVANAVKFTARGEVRIVARLVDPEQPAPRLAFDVIDTGIGISGEQMERLFQPFSQADASTSRVYGGTGLGLAICRRLAEMLDGAISVQSVPGRGSTFTVTLTIAPSERSTMIDRPSRSKPERLPERAAGAHPLAQAADASAAPAQARPRILLAEDTPDLQELTSVMLQAAGAEVSAVDNGELAVRAAATAAAEGRAFDLVLMDMQMPVLDGYEATRRLRADGYAGRIVALTAHAMSGDRQKCLDAGCDDYLPKPIDPNALAALVRDSARSAKGVEATAAAPPPPLPAPGAGEVLVSKYADRPPVARILGTFAERMTERVEAMREAVRSASHGDLERLAHQVKGAAGSYGYPSLSDVACALELQSRDGDWERIAASVDRIAALTEAVVRGLQ